jgi:hypothetical protein
MSVTEKEQFCDENGRFVTMRQMWHAFYDDLKIVINSSQKVFYDEFSLFRDERKCFVMDVNISTSDSDKLLSNSK